MDRMALIKTAYEAFSGFEKPEQCTAYTDFEEGEHNRALAVSTREDLGMDQIGTLAWNPVSAMTPHALAYFMPRLIELAVTGAVDKDGEPFYIMFILFFHDKSLDAKFRLFNDRHKEIMADTFQYLGEAYLKEIKMEGWHNEVCQAARNWRTGAT